MRRRRILQKKKFHNKNRKKFSVRVCFALVPGRFPLSVLIFFPSLDLILIGRVSVCSVPSRYFTPVLNNCFILLFSCRKLDPLSLCRFSSLFVLFKLSCFSGILNYYYRNVDAEMWYRRSLFRCLFGGKQGKCFVYYYSL